MHLWAVKQMMPYFFAAGHLNYVKYGLCYMRAMERIPDEALKQFMKGEHVMRHKVCGMVCCRTCSSRPRTCGMDMVRMGSSALL